ncbi:BREX-1 system adenine-specific DNA-methyltransferase PglX [Pseudomonas sp. QE6]|uniref:class I SAM-dependent DNA methyltransferase n=1 Tax=Pseudomonas TaxID=286 RepID=UPI0021E1D83B|nr:BREX-1 system adenine-specific DNA-methyltransferase PglX [Pseudomonas aeruginosa]MDF3868631.1 BREX-1 system adenine-specific DNA-methyltransferase PglX [Pseudomonas denitrificans (nom. rej.)]MCV0303538.1 lactate dehydrogenase [Pseudomonas aeruginosa]MCV0363567.1 lactate dehydrogenase [Pseudomonas aeruginosa]MDY1145208.1 BREX-1 system adenine-specific DNA-methyltransferase PglX [Pseudomonas aeruginosa]MDY1205665.1 BREX-1 system adenine-specific DNA-methyltransferase PglX [Pseudomonas aerugi
MNAVEIEQAITDLASQPFDRVEFPYAFLQAFGNKETTLKRLRSGATNKSDLGGVLQTSNIHLAVCEPGKVTETLAALKASPATARAKAKYVLATDGETLEAEELESGETVACDYPQFPDHFGFFLPLAGISTVKQIRENSFDIRATSRLNRLYVELLKDNPAWGTAERRHEMNHFMARLIFCFFAEDTDIFNGTGLFTDTLTQMSDRDSSNLHEVMGEIFRAMNTPIAQRASASLPRWADAFPYVNGGLFSGDPDVPRFSRIARSYLLHIGALDWKQINPDIFGSMIQAVADDEERGSLGMHYTSVPNILKVLNPLLLDELRAKLEEAADNPRMLLNLRKRLARIRVFDPACGSGNFLVIAYKQLREIENTINERRGEPGRKSDIPLTNFRGIELRDFSAEIARLALIIAEYQCDVLYRGQKEALLEFLPLSSQNWITRGNALQVDWLSTCPPTGTGVRLTADDLFQSPLDQAQIDFENEGGETYICGNPPYLGSTWQSDDQKDDLRKLFDSRVKNWKSLDYVAGWFLKAADYCCHANAAAAFVSTNSICQGQQVPILWPEIFSTGCQICFAHTSFKWTNLASNNAGVMVAIIGISTKSPSMRRLFSVGDDEKTVERLCSQINAYLVPGDDVVVNKAARPLSGQAEMSFGSKPVDGGHLLMSRDEVSSLGLDSVQRVQLIHRIFGSAEFIRGQERYCLWINDSNLREALSIPSISERIEGVRSMRLSSPKGPTVEAASVAHRFGEVRQVGNESVIIVPSVSSESREYLPCGYEPVGTIVSNLAFALFDAPLWNMAIVASKLHLTWIGTICGKMKTDFRYSNTLGWNTFPIPVLTEKNKADLTRCAEDILLAREAHFPATIADLYDPETMPENLRAAHERNDEVLERIYIGRCFKNDTERLEKLFELYTEMTAKQKLGKAKR